MAKLDITNRLKMPTQGTRSVPKTKSEKKTTEEADGIPPERGPFEGATFLGYLYESSGYTETGPSQVGFSQYSRTLRPGTIAKREVKIAAICASAVCACIGNYQPVQCPDSAQKETGR
jgi:hypothetical protein